MTFRGSSRKAMVQVVSSPWQGLPLFFLLTVLCGFSILGTVKLVKYKSESELNPNGVVCLYGLASHLPTLLRRRGSLFVPWPSINLGDSQ